MSTYAVRFPKDFTDAIDRLASRHGVSREEVLRLAITGLSVISDAEEKGDETRIVPKGSISVGKRIVLS